MSCACVQFLLDASLDALLDTSNLGSVRLQETEI